jgi:hypothetical protein
LRLSHPAVAECLDYFEDFGPRREWPCVLAFVLIDSKQELKLLVGHAAFFSGLSVVTEPSARPAPTIQPKPPVNDALPAPVTVTMIF